MKTLYVSDLDGTLLAGNQKTSDFTNETINALVKKGMIFSYATARSYITAQKATKGVNAKIPLIVYNGTFVVDNQTGKMMISNYLPDDIGNVINDLINNGIYPIVYSFIDGKEKFSYVESRMSDGVKDFVNSRKGDIRENPVKTREELLQGKIFYISCIDDAHKLEIFYYKYKNRYRCLFQKDVYTNDQWLEIMPLNATKANAVLQVKERLGCDRVIAFGDGLNDMDMFKIADASFAVANAADELKSIATAVIQSNDDDGVAKFLKKIFN